MSPSYTADSEWKLICIYNSRNSFEALKPSIYVQAGRCSAVNSLAGHTNVLESVLCHVLDDFEHAFRMQEDLAFREVSSRLAHLLLNLGEQFGVPGEQGVRIALKLSQEKMATMIGSSRPAVNIALNQFRNDGLVSLDNRQITLLLPEYLHKL